jgi:phosphoglycerate dehydrogenase-like enzyme
MTTRIAILDDYTNTALSAADWDSLGADTEITVFDTYIEGEAALVEALQGFDVVIGMRERTAIPKSLIDALPNLKLLVTTGMRNFSFDMDAARDQGVVVSGTAMLGYPAAEHAVALMMALFKKIPLEDHLMHEGGWQGDVPEGMSGKTLGILGLGKLGSRVARVGLALDMEVIAWSENLTKERCEEIGVRYATKDALFAGSDVISIHLVSSDRTRGMVGIDELTSMKPSAYLINTSRGPIIDEAALIEALSGGTIGGAGIDVYDVEPLPADHPLRSFKNAVLTGHTGYVVKEMYALAYGEVLENVQAWMDGAPIRVLNGEESQ